MEAALPEEKFLCSRRRTAHSSASTFVESATTSVFRIVETVQSWLIGDSTETVPSGQTGESSIGWKTLGSRENAMRSHSIRRDGLVVEGLVNRFETWSSSNAFGSRLFALPL